MASRPLSPTTRRLFWASPSVGALMVSGRLACATVAMADLRATEHRRTGRRGGTLSAIESGAAGRTTSPDPVSGGRGAARPVAAAVGQAQALGQTGAEVFRRVAVE